MQYSIINDNYRNFDVFEINKLNPRAYAIPFKNLKKLKSTTCLTERYNSDIVTVLSGDWDFKFYEKLSILPNSFDSDRIQFDNIKVPSTWQRTGYQSPVYLNSRYEFKLYPPELPEDFSVGVYRKTFNIDNKNKTYIISFLGVISCLDLYLNGEFIGYSEGAHNTAEFDLSKFVVEGENELIAVVRRWSTATYLECQDMFRENGIFRDVLLYEYDESYINDYEVKTSLVGGSNYNLSLSVDIIGQITDCKIKAEVFNGKKCIAESEKPASNNTVFNFENLDVQQWSAEIPNIYEVYLTLSKEDKVINIIRNYAGFKTVEIVKNVFKFNNKAIKFKGVNHHDTNEENGYVMTADDIELDLKLMKQFNVNSIRTSHYPPDPMLLTLADIMGFYIVDEADIETHGAGSIGPHSLYKINLISNDLKWADRYVDRVSRMYYRDRNHPSITMWSLGNESGGYKCQDKCNEFLKKVCPEIPVHYEAAIRTKRFAYDVISEMYTSSENCEKTGKHTRGSNPFQKTADFRNAPRGNELLANKYSQKPFFLCEYCHAMGVGPGCLEDYWKIFYQYENLMGGCIWEWADHAVKHDLNDPKNTYESEYTYGGDHKEVMHDNNFCVDGLVYPDRTPHTGALEMKAVYRPLRAEKISDTQFKFTNTNRFRSSSYININWELCKNCTPVSNGTINPDIQPCQSEIVTLPVEIKDSNSDYQLNFTYTDENGFEIAKEQIILQDVQFDIIGKSKEEVSIEENDDTVNINLINGNVMFSKKSGELLDYTVNGKQLINKNAKGFAKGFLPNVFRAPIDNDSHGGTTKWNAKKLEKAIPVFKEIEVSNHRDYAKIEVEYNICSDKSTIFESEICYKVYSNGLIIISNELERKLFSNKDIPRFGITVELPAELNNVEYYGRGPYENACDFNSQSTVGIYKTNVKDMHEPYILPQDNGNHGGTKYVNLTDNDGKGLSFIGLPKFSFSVHDYTQKTLTDAAHREDIKNQNTTFVSIDGFFRGVGSNSCGPDTLEKYRFTFKDEIKFKFAVKPIV